MLRSRAASVRLAEVTKTASSSVTIALAWRTPAGPSNSLFYRFRFSRARGFFGFLASQCPVFTESSRDRIASDCAIRHPVWPIAALQRRVRFSARLAGFCRGRCHQRRARRVELASFSVLVSNLDFRVPRLRQIGKRALTGPCGWREKRPSERLSIEAGATGA